MNNKINIDFADLEENGFQIVDLFDHDEVLAVEKYFHSLNDLNFEFSGLKYSLMIDDIALKQKVAKKLKEVLAEKDLGGLNSFGGSFIEKISNSKIEFNLHQDWSYTDEKIFRNCYTLWVPLQDVDETNGCLYVVPRSHRFYDNYRSFSLETARVSMLEDETLKRKIVSVPMKKGQALLFKQALFHGSFPNQSDKDRICFVSILKNREVPLYYYDKISDTKIQKYKVTEELFEKDLKSVASGTIPEYFQALEIIDYQHEMISVDSLIKKTK